MLVSICSMWTASVKAFAFWMNDCSLCMIAVCAGTISTWLVRHWLCFGITHFTENDQTRFKPNRKDNIIEKAFYSIPGWDVYLDESCDVDILYNWYEVFSRRKRGEGTQEYDMTYQWLLAGFDIASDSTLGGIYYIHRNAFATLPRRNRTEKRKECLHAH